MKKENLSQFNTNSEAKLFGKMPNGKPVFLYELINSNEIRLNITNYGATITALKIPLKNRKLIDVVLGFDTLDAYSKSFTLARSPYFGATIGRYAGRINKGTFCLNEKVIHLNKNHNEHSLHGGTVGFSQKSWETIELTSGTNPSITLRYTSPDKEEHFPGKLTVTIKYTLTEENELIIEYNANTTEDTILNLTHHGYFNLDGHACDLSNQDLIVNSKSIIETTEDMIPNGSFLTVANSPFDFTSARKCPKKMDTSFVLTNKQELAATLVSNKNGLKMSIYTDQPSVHIYIGGECKSIVGKENTNYHSFSGICFETQNYPDAPNQEHFPSSTLRKGATYAHKTIYKLESISENTKQI